MAESLKEKFGRKNLMNHRKSQLQEQFFKEFGHVSDGNYPDSNIPLGDFWQWIEANILPKENEDKDLNAFIKDQIRRAWNGIAFAGTKDPYEDYEYFQRIMEPFNREVNLIINNILKHSELVQKTKIKDFILPRVQKFIDKVETGGARSVETYKDMKEIRDLLNQL